MKRLLLTLGIVALSLAPLSADLTITQTITLEGGLASMLGGMKPTLTTRIKGTKARTDIDVMDQKMTTIADLTTKEITVLNSANMTAMVMNAAAIPAAPAGTPMPKIDVTFKPTGQTKTVDGISCDDYALGMTIGLAEMAGGSQVPPDAAAMMKDVRIVMNGNSCIAKGGPGAEEYIAFQKAATAAALDAVLKGGLPGQQMQGFDKLFTATSSAPGLAYLTEIMMTVEGSGPMVDMLKQMGAMKMTQKVTSVSTDALADDLFTVPADYKIEKK